MDPNTTPSTTANNLSPPQYFGTPKLDIPQAMPAPNLHDRPSTQYDDVAEEMSNPTTRSRFPDTPPVGRTYPTHFRLPQSTPSSGNTTVSVTEQLRVIHDFGNMIEDVDEYIERKLLSLNKTMGDEDAVQQIVFHLITRARLSVKVMTKLRQKYLTCFSRMKWKFVCLRFHNLLSKPANDHNRIPTFVLQRSRLPMRIFDGLVVEMNKSILRVGHRSSLGNEAAVHHYILPVFNLISDLFEGRVLNHPELTLSGEIGKSGRCEFTYAFMGCSMLLLIELKFDLRSLTTTELSDIIAQVSAAANNEEQEFDSSAINVILTDSIVWQFFQFDFKTMHLWRGVTSETEGYYNNNSQSLLLPVDEDVREYHDYFKMVVETVWDTFLKSYCAGVAALICKSRRQQGTENQLLFALTQASSGGVHAHGRLRYAHQIRSDEVAETGLMDLCASLRLLENENLKYTCTPEKYAQRRAHLALV